MLRHETPYELAKLKDRDLLTVPAEPALAASVVSENARITHQNELNKAERESRMMEIENRLAAKLSRAMRVKAPLLLAKILKECAHKDARGAVIKDSYNGVMMFDELKELVKEDVAEYDQERYTKAAEKLRSLKRMVGYRIFAHLHTSRRKL